MRDSHDIFFCKMFSSRNLVLEKLHYAVNNCFFLAFLLAVYFINGSKAGFYTNKCVHSQLAVHIHSGFSSGHHMGRTNTSTL